MSNKALGKPPEKRLAEADGGVEQRMSEAAAVLAFAMHLFARKGPELLLLLDPYSKDLIAHSEEQPPWRGRGRSTDPSSIRRSDRPFPQLVTILDRLEEMGLLLMVKVVLRPLWLHAHCSSRKLCLE